MGESAQTHLVLLEPRHDVFRGVQGGFRIFHEFRIPSGPV